MEITKGPYFANQGDFATAGAVNLVSRDDFEHSSVGFGFGGSPGHGVAELSRAAHRAARSSRDNDRRRRSPPRSGAQTVRSTTPRTGTSTSSSTSSRGSSRRRNLISLTEMSYAGNWHGSGQIPARARRLRARRRASARSIPTKAATPRATSSRSQYKLRPTENSELERWPTSATYRFNLFSNFTLYQRDPDNGDEIEQIDRRTFYGGKLKLPHRPAICTRSASTRRSAPTCAATTSTKSSGTRRIASSSRTCATTTCTRRCSARTSTKRSRPAKWLRVDVGGRADSLSFAVDNRLATSDPTNPHSGTDGAHQLSPKPSRGRHAARREERAARHLTRTTGTAFTRTTCAASSRARGHAAHARDGRRARRAHASLRSLGLRRSRLAARPRERDGLERRRRHDASVSDPTNRYGLELETRYEFTPWLAADLDVTFTHSQFTTESRQRERRARARAESRPGRAGSRRATRSGRASRAPGCASTASAIAPRRTTA